MAKLKKVSGVLVIYTGGTIGSVRRNPNNYDDPLVPGTVENLFQRLMLKETSPLSASMTFGPRKVDVQFVQTESLLDSTNMRPVHWLQIANIIKDNYDRYEGFVILQGTDTLAFTASALAFLFENLGKPVVITGSQRPIGELRSDGFQNLISSIEIAAAVSLGAVPVPEVCVFFRDKLMRGCRVTKTSAIAYTAFSSPNYPPLGVAGEHIDLRRTTDRPRKIHFDGKFTVHEKLDDHIAVIEVSPLMSANTLKRILNAADLKGVILKAYGTGNAPTDKAFLNVIEKAIQSEKNPKQICVVSQCVEGHVELGLYAVSAGLLDRGVISGSDMTSEAAQTKMAFLLANRELYEPESLAAMMQINLRGEMGQNLFELPFSGSAATVEALLEQQRDFPAVDYFHEADIDAARLRIMGFEVVGEKKAKVDLRIVLNPSGDPGKSRGDRVMDFDELEWDIQEGRGETLYLRLTEAVRSHTKRSNNKIAVLCRSGQRIAWRNMSLAIFTKG